MQNGNGHVEIELDTIPGNENIFNELCNLIKNCKREIGAENYPSHLGKIEEILSESAEIIFSENKNGKNVFHFLANNPDRCPELLKLFTAYFNGGRIDRDQVWKLLDAKFGANESTPVHLAVNNGFVDFVREALDKFPSLLSEVDKNGNSPLHIAAGSSLQQSFDVFQVILGKIERNNLSEKLLLELRNDLGHNVCHALCYKVPTNADSQIKSKMGLLLGVDCTRDVLSLFDKEQKTPLHLLCSSQDQFKEPDSNENLKELMKQLVTRRSGANIPTGDYGRTALHLLAISECPSLLKILVEKSLDKIDLMSKDRQGMMAIHYATEKATRPKSQAIIETLTNWPMFKEYANAIMSKTRLEPQDLYRNYLFWETFNDGEMKQTALTSACKAQSTQTARHFLQQVFQAKKDFGIWFAGKGDDQIFSLKSVYENTPEALELLLDKAIQIDWESSTEVRVQFSTDISVLTALQKPIQEEVKGEMEYLNLAENWSEETQEKILLHPLTQCALHLIWEKMIPYRIVWTVLNVLWLAAYLILLPFQSVLPKTGALYTLVGLTVLSSIYYIFEGIVLSINRCGVVRHVKDRGFNWTEVAVTGFVVWAIFKEFEESSFLNYTASFGVILSSFMFTINCGVILTRGGIYVGRFVQTLKYIVIPFICVLPMVCAFLRSFQLLLPEQFQHGTVWGLTKMFVMMTGEQDYGEMYEQMKKQSENHSMNASAEGEAGSESTLSYFSYLCFLSFLFIICICFYNVVTAVAVDKIQSMRMTFEIDRILCQLRLINYVQRTMVSVLDPVVSCFPCLDFGLPTFISYREISKEEVIFDPKINWYIDIYADGPVKRNGLGKCGNNLPKQVKEKVVNLFKNGQS